MASVVLSGDTSGSVTLAAPTISGTTTQTLVAVSGTLAPIVSGTAVASTSGTSIDFTGIPSWVKRITVMFSGFSTSGTSAVQIQIGSGSIANTGYDSGAWSANANNASSTTGFLITAATVAAGTYSGTVSICLFNSSTNLWVESGSLGQSVVPASNGGANVSGGNKTLSGTLDRVRITTVNGTDTFDAGSINILYE